MRIRGRWWITSGIREEKIFAAFAASAPPENKKPASAQGAMRVWVLLDNVKRILAERRSAKKVRIGIHVN